ncbi:unnamed protein product [Adineta steineri]|uniref:Nephrin-like protein n=1 Tax=Adineta steineri TaxID=433720 RepID=A0A815AZ75_9BILA|nr:unnamed protein product [Adineta steineri]
MPLSLLIQLLIIYAILYLSNCDNQFYRIQPNDVSALVGSNITIPCVIALPHGDVQWTKDGLALGYDRQLPAFPTWSINGDENRGEFNFMIQSLKLEDEGVFACEVSPYKDAPALKQVAHIRALVQPKYVQIHDQSITNQSSMITVRYDETIHQVHCQVDGARPAAHIKWFNETGHEFPAASRTYTQNRLFSTTSTLTFVPSLLFDKKRFTCHVHHETLLGKINKLYTSIEIRITSPPNRPMIYGYTSTYRLLNGSYLTLSCQSFGGNPLGRLSWYRLDNEHKRLSLIDNSSIIFQQQNLTINNISMIITPSDNNMTYSCHVTNDYLFSLDQILQTNITVQVAFGPSFVYIRDNNMSATTLIEGTPRQFKCRTSSSNPRSIVTWKINGQILSPDIDPLEEPGEFSGTVVQITKTLGLDKSLKEYHKKILTCEARNPDTGHTVIDTTQLNVIYDSTSIEMHGIIQDKIIKSGDTLTAECILKGGHPLGNIVWYKVLPSSLKYQTLFNDRILSSSFSPNLTFEAILYIANVTKTDYGIYQCKAENKLGIDVSDIILTGLTVPDPPSQVEITNVSHSSLLIHWIPGFDGGSQQTFQIRYRLSTDNRYSYIFIPFGLQSYDLKNLRLGSEYQISIRSNNSHHLSEWTNDIIKSTSLYLPSPSFSSSDPSTTKYSLTFLIIIFMIGLLIIFINIILVFFFVIKRRRSHVTSDNSSTTGTNETEANTVDIFQPIPSNFFLPTATATPINSYQKYEDDDIQRPFVSSYSAANMSNQDNTSSSNGIIKKNRYSPYDNFRVHHYYPANSDNNFVTYRSFKDGNNSSSDIHGFIKAELV